MRKRILINYIIILGISSLIIGGFAYYFIKNSYFISKEEKFLSNLALIQDTLEENYSDLDRVNYFRLAQDLSSKINSRVSFINIKGNPMADSLNNSIIFQNLATSQEYKSALRGETSIVRTFSPEIGKDFFYLAIYPVRLGGEEIILRLGDTHDEVWKIINEFIKFIVISIIISMILIIPIAFISIGKLVRPVRELTLASKLISEGNFDKRIIVHSRDEIGDLALSFNQMTEQLKSTIGELERMEKMRKDFVANVSHELRTPLTSIGGFVETLKIRDLDEETRKRILDIIDFETDRLKNLINELLRLSQIESALDVRSPSPLNIGEAVLEVIELLQPLLKEKAIDFQLDLDKNLEPIRMDKGLFKQILINLIENGIKYNYQGGQLSLAISKEEDLKILVKDQGMGIGEEEVDWLCERFYRGKASSTNNKQGSGLGLAIVDSIVRLYQGRLEIDSRLGEGSSFTIIIPAKKINDDN